VLVGCLLINLFTLRRLQMLLEPSVRE